MLPDYSAFAHYCLRMHQRWSQSSCLQKESAVHVHALIPEQRIHMDASFMPRFLLFTRTGRSRRIMSRITARSLSLSRTSTKFLPVWFAYVISEAEGVIGERFFLFFTSPHLFLSLSPTCHHKTSFFALFCCRSSTLYIIFRRWKKMQLSSKHAIEVASERETWMTAFSVTANNIVV